MLDHMSSLYFFSNEPPTTQIYPDGHTVSLHDALPISPGKAAALARFAGAAKAQAVARLPDDRRAATLVAFIRTLEASASDDVIDLFDAVSTKMFRSEEHTSELQSLMRISYAVFCLKKKRRHANTKHHYKNDT